MAKIEHIAGSRADVVQSICFYHETFLNALLAHIITAYFHALALLGAASPSAGSGCVSTSYSNRSQLQPYLYTGLALSTQLLYLVIKNDKYDNKDNLNPKISQFNGLHSEIHSKATFIINRLHSIKKRQPIFNPR